MKWWWQKTYAPEFEAYRDGTPRKLDADRPVSECRFLVLDTESTGFKPGTDRILSLSVVEVFNGRILLKDLASWLFFHTGVRMNSATSVHGIMPGETAQGTDEKTVLTELLLRLTGTIVVGHHIGFDMAMLNEACRRHFGAPLCNVTLDTGKLAMASLDAFAKTGYPGQRDPGLDEVCTLCGIEPIDRHTAEGDTFTTATLFLTLCAHLQRRKKRPLLVKDLPLV